MSALLLQLSRIGFLILLWFFIWSIMRALRSDLLLASGFRPTDPPQPKRQRRGGWRSEVSKYLVVTAGPLAGTRITLSGQPVLIGRSDDSTLVLDDDFASAKHARLVPQGSEWLVEDLGSTNGTFINKERVTTAVPLEPGTPVKIGTTIIELRS